MVRIEKVYLMNVILYFPNYKDCLNFIQINSSCFDCIVSLKRLPFSLKLKSTSIWRLFKNIQTVNLSLPFKTLIPMFPRYEIEIKTKQEIGHFFKDEMLSGNTTRLKLRVFSFHLQFKKLKVLQELTIVLLHFSNGFSYHYIQKASKQLNELKYLKKIVIEVKSNFADIVLMILSSINCLKIKIILKIDYLTKQFHEQLNSTIKEKNLDVVISYFEIDPSVKEDSVHLNYKNLTFSFTNISLIKLKNESQLDSYLPVSIESFDCYDHSFVLKSNQIDLTYLNVVNTLSLNYLNNINTYSLKLPTSLTKLTLQGLKNLVHIDSLFKLPLKKIAIISCNKLVLSKFPLTTHSLIIHDCNITDLQDTNYAELPLKYFKISSCSSITLLIISSSIEYLELFSLIHLQSIIFLNDAHHVNLKTCCILSCPSLNQIPIPHTIETSDIKKKYFIHCHDFEMNSSNHHIFFSQINSELIFILVIVSLLSILLIYALYCGINCFREVN